MFADICSAQSLNGFIKKHILALTIGVIFYLDIIGIAFYGSSNVFQLFCQFFMERSEPSEFDKRPGDLNVYFNGFRAS